jgi:hypothetical protein
MPLLERQFKIELEIWIVMHSDLRRSSHMRSMFEHLATGLARYAAAS